MELFCKFYNGMDSSACVCVRHLACNFKAGHPVVFQDNNYVLTVDTIKYVFKAQTYFDHINRSS